MNQDDYRNCMRQYMTGKGKTKEERQHDMCVGAKLCTGKAKTKEESLSLCEEARVLAAGKPPKERRRRITGCKICIGKDIKQAILGASKDLEHSVILQESLKKIPDCPDIYGFEVGG